MPEAAEHVFGYFRELCWTRRPGYSGPLGLEYQEIEAWCRLTQRTLGQPELRLLMEMDKAYIRAINKKQDAPDTSDVIDQPLTAELFDALFASVNDNRHGHNMVENYA